MTKYKISNIDFVEGWWLKLDDRIGWRLHSPYLVKFEKFMRMILKVDLHTETCSIWLYEWFNTLDDLRYCELAKNRQNQQNWLTIETSEISLELPTFACCSFRMDGRIDDMEDDTWWLICREHISIIILWIGSWFIWKLKSNETRKNGNRCLHPTTNYFSRFWRMHKYWSISLFVNPWKNMLIWLVVIHEWRVKFSILIFRHGG